MVYIIIIVIFSVVIANIFFDLSSKLTGKTVVDYINEWEDKKNV